MAHLITNVGRCFGGSNICPTVQTLLSSMTTASKSSVLSLKARSARSTSLARSFFRFSYYYIIFSWTLSEVVVTAPRVLSRNTKCTELINSAQVECELEKRNTINIAQQGILCIVWRCALEVYFSLLFFSFVLFFVPLSSPTTLTRWSSSWLRRLNWSKAARMSRVSPEDEDGSNPNGTF